jgi:hypothetical protein
MSTTVFHFTDTIRLPWILAERQLNPTRGMCAADYPRPTFLWATTNAYGDHTAAVSYGDSRRLWRQGGTLLVKFILPAEDFTPWPEMYPQHPEWTPEQVARVERNGRKKGSLPEQWMCRTETLPIERWLGIETRSYYGCWRPFDFTAYTTLSLDKDNAAKAIQTFHQPFNEVCAAVIEIDGRAFVSKRLIPHDGRTLYTCGELSH